MGEPAAVFLTLWFAADFVRWDIDLAGALYMCPYEVIERGFWT